MIDFSKYQKPLRLDESEEFKKIDDIVEYLKDKDLKWIKVAKFQRINAVQSKGGEEVKTVGSDGNEETERTTKAGDWVVNNVYNKDNKWIIDDKTFKKKYVEDKDGVYRPKGGPMLAAKISDCEESGVEFAPPNWGGDVIKIKNDGYFMKDPSNENDIYAISKKDFDSTYKEAKDVKESRYTRRDIMEALKYWRRQLKALNEDFVDGEYVEDPVPHQYSVVGKAYQQDGDEDNLCEVDCEFKFQCYALTPFEAAQIAAREFSKPENDYIVPGCDELKVVDMTDNRDVTAEFQPEFDRQCRIYFQQR